MADLLLDERFLGPRLDPRLQWLNAPPAWSLASDPARLIVTPAAPTDFWHRTYYGFAADSGHVLHLPVTADFVLTTHVRFVPRHQYDQAGLFVRATSDCWLKTSVEYEPEGPCRLGAVVTNAGWSDWSTQDFPAQQREVLLRVRRRSADYFVDAADPRTPDRWQQLRIAHLHAHRARQPVLCGLYACSPQGPGFQAEFLFLRCAAEAT